LGGRAARPIDNPACRRWEELCETNPATAPFEEWVQELS
jgi:hypothetical protein